VAAVAAPRAAAPAVAVAACKPEEDLDELADYEIVEDFPDLELEDDPLLSLPPGLAEPRAVTNGRQAAPVVPPVAAQAARPAERAASPVAARMPAAPARAPEPRREMPSVGPAASKATPVPAPSNFYIVKEGESFFSISKKLYDAAKYFVDIQKANPDVTPQRMRPGDIVVIPEVPGARLHREHLATEQDLKALRPGPTVRLAEPTVHVIALGETLQAISKKYYDRYNAYDHILEANPGLDPRKLVEGTQIVIPALTD